MSKYILKSALFICLAASIMLPVVGHSMPRGKIKINHHHINIQLAANDADRMSGLMFIRYLPKNSGMLFLFNNPSRYCMWMKNTYIPLSVAFIDENGIVSNIENMQPESKRIHCAKATVLYALEMNIGWFGKHKISSGSQLDLSSVKNIKAD